MERLLVVCGSSTPMRAGRQISDWFVSLTENNIECEVRVVHLAELNLPIFDEPNLPRLRQYKHQHTKDWSAIVEAADAVVFIVPEFNHSVSALVKNAIDYLYFEWAGKVVGMITYGASSSGGLYAAMSLGTSLRVMDALILEQSVAVPFIRDNLSAAGFTASAAQKESALQLIAELERAVAAAADNEPYKQVAY